MMNPTYHFQKMRDLLEEYEPSASRDSAASHLALAEEFLKDCRPTEEALQRDQCNAD